MSQEINVRKHSGEMEYFSWEKLHNSLTRAGADQDSIAKVSEELKYHMFSGMTTGHIYKLAFKILRKLKQSVAARYGLRKAIMELGPSGHPFEQLVGAVIKELGYHTQVGQIIQGHCVSHEIDVLARNTKELIMVECKFYNSQGKNCNVQVPLYINSRFHDVKKNWEKETSNQGLKFSGWVVTNTRFTNDAIDYGTCAGLNLISWDYPRGGSLKEMVENYALYPVTALTGLTKKQKETLIENDVVLCKQLLLQPDVVGKIETDKRKQLKILKEADDLCGNA